MLVCSGQRRAFDKSFMTPRREVYRVLQNPATTHSTCGRSLCIRSLKDRQKEKTAAWLPVCSCSSDSGIRKAWCIDSPTIAIIVSYEPTPLRRSMCRHTHTRRSYAHGDAPRVTGILPSSVSSFFKTGDVHGATSAQRAGGAEWTSRVLKRAFLTVCLPSSRHLGM
jgi:hypothetical protein